MQNQIPQNECIPEDAMQRLKELLAVAPELRTQELMDMLDEVYFLLMDSQYTEEYISD